MTYVAAGVRGNHTLFKELLSEIRFGKKDYLFLIGDLMGNPDETMDLLEELSYAENIWTVASAGDRLTYECLSGFENALKAGGTPDPVFLQKMQAWAAAGGRELLDAFRALDADQKEGILDYLSEIPPVEKVTVKDKDYLMTFAGIENYDGTDPLELGSDAYFGENTEAAVEGYVSVIAGYDGTDRVRRENTVLRIDCGAGKGGKLCAVRL